MSKKSQRLKNENSTKIYLLSSQYKNVPWNFQKWKENGIETEFLEDWTTADRSIPVLCFADLLTANARTWLTKNQPAFYTARGYLGNHIYKHRKWYRASINGWANIKLENIPYERWPLLNLPKHPWKVKQVKNVLIAPSKMTAPIWEPDIGFGWAEHIASKFHGADIRIRYKGKTTPQERWKTLWDDLDWADLVVSQSSAITVEAFWYGKKVISLYPCNTWAAERTTLEDWQNPKEPKLRDVWHEHLAWSQFSNEEWANGEAIVLLEKYLNKATIYHHNYKYNFIR